MKHSSRRILALLLALSLCIGMMPMSIFADDTPAPVEVIEQSGEDAPAIEKAEGGTGILEEETKDPVIEEEEGDPAPVEEFKQDDVKLQDVKLEDVNLEEGKLDMEKKAGEPMEMKKVEEAPADLLKAAPAEEAQPAEKALLDAPAEEKKAEEKQPGSAVDFAAEAATDALAEGAENKDGEEVKQYTVSFVYDYSNGESTGNSKVSIQKVAAGETAKEEMVRGREGYRFLGWFEKGAESPFDFSTPIMSDTTLYTRWEKDDSIYKVTFEKNLTPPSVWTTDVENQEVPAGGYAKNPGMPVPNGGGDSWKFVGWFLKEGGEFAETPFDFDRTPISSNITLYGKWEVVEVQVFFLPAELNSGVYTRVDVPYGKTLNANEVKEIEKKYLEPREYYDFAGWYQDAGSKEFVSDEPFDFSTPLTYDVYSKTKNTLDRDWGRVWLRAVWTPKEDAPTFTVTFLNEDGSVYTTKDVVKGDCVDEIRIQSEDGRYFDAWYLDGARYDFRTPVSEDITLVARFVEDEADLQDVVVLYYSNYPGSDNPQKPWYQVHYSYGDIKDTGVPFLDFSEIEKDGFYMPSGYTFLGWRLEGDEDETLYDKDHLYTDIEKPEVPDHDGIKDFGELVGRINVTDLPATEVERPRPETPESSEAEYPNINPGVVDKIPYGDIKFYAVWAEACTVTYFTNYPANTLDDLKPVSMRYVKEDGPQTFTAVTFKEVFGEEELDEMLNQGYRFKGWTVTVYNEDPNAATAAEKAEMAEMAYEQAHVIQETMKKPDLSARFVKERAEEKVKEEQAAYAEAADVAESETAAEDLPEAFFVPDEELAKELELYKYVELEAEWEPIPLVTYHTNYSSVGSNMEEGTAAYPYPNADLKNIENERYNLYTFETAFNGEYDAPAGYRFIGWIEVVSDVIETAVPAEGTAVGNDEPAAQKKAAKAKAEVVEDEVLLAVEDDNSTRPLHLRVDLYAKWEPCPVVYYHTEYPKSTGKKNGETYFNYESKSEPYVVKTFEDAFEGTSFEVPAGWQFVEWVVKWKDDDPPIDQEYPDELEAEEAEQAQEEVIYDAKRAAVEFKAAEKEKAEAEFKPVEKDPEKEPIDEVKPEPGDVQAEEEEPKTAMPGDQRKLHDRVDLYAVWERCYTVVYHQVDPESDFAKELGIEDEPTFTKVYSTAEYKDADGKFTVLKYEDTGMDPVKGYNFTYWTMETIDLLEVAVDDEELSDMSEIDPGTVIVKDYEEYKEAVELKDDYREARMFKAVKLEKVEAEKAEAETAAVLVDKVPAEAAAEKEKADAVPEAEYKEDEKEKDEGDEADLTTGDEIYPGDSEKLHYMVHLYAHWKEKPYTVIWIDEGGDVEDPLTTGIYEGFDPDEFDPDKEYEANKGSELPDKEVDGVTYSFDHWELIENEDHTVVYEAVYTAPYTVIWIDEDGDVKDPLTTGGYNEYDPETFDPAAEYDANKGPELKDKEVDGKTYTFDHWEPKENVDDNTFVYEAAYRPVENQTNPPTGGSNNPTTNPTTNTPAEDVSEIENNETPLAPATEDPVEDVDDEEVADTESPLAGFEVEPEEDDEIAEEATPLSPFTGDDRNTVVWGIVSILSLLGIILVARRRKEE